VKPPGNDLAGVVRLARDAERQAAERLRAAEERLAGAQERLAAVERYVSEYQTRASSAPIGAARRVLDERRFLAQLQQTLAMQSRIADQDRRHAELVRGHWLAARRKREGLEQLVAERQQQAQLLAEQAEQQALDDRPRLRSGNLTGAGPLVA